MEASSCEASYMNNFPKTSRDVACFVCCLYDETGEGEGVVVTEGGVLCN